MAGFKCRCGEVLSTVYVPNDVQLHVYTDREWLAFTEEEVIRTENIPFPTHDVWRCPKCERISVFEAGYGNKLWKVYAVEELADD